MSKPNSSDSR